ncbi:MAG: type II toxin-antitoxin system VapC family toxin [Acidobacteriaceae bacterium]|nr:type II toxin-antitoxin system VapC family toxin [Acidobacteriaceae bacterium]MBV9499540.1 type II toxin-antitoxin system VapC family toxin [Acidobacteriaceae bacterium]
MSKGILLDTVAFVEFLQGTLPARIRQTIERADRRFLSVITPWEILLKRDLRDRIRPVDIDLALEKIGLEIRTILIEHLWFLWHLPEFPDHRDPFDRLLIAQACTHNLTLITSDRRFSLYPRLSLIEY